MPTPTPTPEQLVDAIGGVYGVHPGHRAAHARGTLCAGHFTASESAREISRAAHLGGEPVPAHVRFSNGSGDPGSPDGERDGRGMAVKFYLPGGATTDIVAISPPVFPVRTPQDFLEFNAARRPDPDSGQPDLQRLGAFLAEHPETAEAVARIVAMPPVASYLQTSYHGLHSFRFLADSPPAAGRFGRYHWRPEAGEATLTDEEARARGHEYLQDDLNRRLAAGPAAFALELTLAGEGDPIDDPTAQWPATRERVVLGRLEIHGLAFDRDRDGDILVFDPNRLTDGIEASGDEILAARSPAYSVSVARRTA